MSDRMAKGDIPLNLTATPLDSQCLLLYGRSEVCPMGDGLHKQVGSS